jgi:hypothetical protein
VVGLLGPRNPALSARGDGMTELQVLEQLRTILQDILLVGLGIFTVGVVRVGLSAFQIGNQR